MINRQYYFSAVSITAHVILLLLLVCSFSLSKEVIRPGEDKSHLVSSYLYQESIAQSRPLERKQEIKSIPKKTVTPVKKADISIKAVPQAALRSAPRVSAQAQPALAAGNGEPIPELVARLHVAIQQKQKYPANALQMEREGRVTVVFLLNVNGTVEQLRIAASSGTASLDTAALAAVNEAAPFAGVDKYLQNPQEYSIDVVFQLT
jgi:TonB family protein